MKLQQPCESSTFECPLSTSRGPKVVQQPWNNNFSTWPSVRGNSCTHNNRQTATGEIQKGTGGRGREEGDGTENVINCRDVCRKLSWHFMTIYDVLCQWKKETEIVIKCRKLSWHVVNCRDVCRKLSWHFFPVPFPPSPFGFRRCNNCKPTTVKWRLLRNRVVTAKCNDNRYLRRMRLVVVASAFKKPQVL